MHQQPFVLEHDQRPRAQPCEQLVAVRRFENFAERVVVMRAAVAGGDGKQMEVMVAQNSHGTGAELAHRAQHRERFGSAIDQIADQP